MSTRVIWACRPELLAIKEALQDHRQPISTAALRQLKTFLTDPLASPLFGTDPGPQARLPIGSSTTSPANPERPAPPR